ncbi:programmed cell death 1 ligand 1-like [Lycodopsis pacificus]
MDIHQHVVVFVVLTFLRTLNGADAADCVFMRSCILPCSFQPGEELVIHWIQVTTGYTVHSYYHNQDQFGRQDPRFKDRTSLFKDQISIGNASLRLTGVKVQDRGPYKCYTGTKTGTREPIIKLNMHAPVREVDIQQVENRITCSSEGIFPEPELTWSTSSQSSVTLQNKPTVQQTEQQLYSISSSLMVSGTDLDYSCTVSTPTNKRRATWSQPTSINGSATETTIPCRSSNTPLTGLIWRFNHSHIILNRTGTDSTVSEEWRQQVESVSESGSLTLKDLSSDQEGMYTCELSTAEETYVTNTFLRIETSPGSPHVAAIIGVVVLSVVIGKY